MLVGFRRVVVLQLSYVEGVLVLLWRPVLLRPLRQLQLQLLMAAKLNVLLGLRYVYLLLGLVVLLGLCRVVLLGLLVVLLLARLDEALLAARAGVEHVVEDGVVRVNTELKRGQVHVRFCELVIRRCSVGAFSSSNRVQTWRVWCEWWVSELQVTWCHLKSVVGLCGGDF